jgi:phosphopantetheinyl transferase (holo-ACP synthase)
VGVALVATERVRRLMRRFGEVGLARVFTPAELDYARRAADPGERLAARLAAKLALRNALGRERPVPLGAIEVQRDADGRPGLSWPGAAVQARVSISHERELSIASVWLEV